MSRSVALPTSLVQVQLRSLMTQHAIGESELARQTGVPQSTIHRVLKGHNLEPRDSTLLPLATYFGITVEQLRRGTIAAKSAYDRAMQCAKSAMKSTPASTALESEDGLDPIRGVPIPEVDLVVTGEPGTRVPMSVDSADPTLYPPHWFERVGARPEDLRSMKVVGDSMEPLLHPGDRITIHLADTRIVDRSVYAFFVDHLHLDIRIRRFFWTLDGRLRIVSDHPDKTLYPDEYLAPHALDHIRILGRVIDKSGPGGL